MRTGICDTFIIWAITESERYMVVLHSLLIVIHLYLHRKAQLFCCQYNHTILKQIMCSRKKEYQMKYECSNSSKVLTPFIEVRPKYV